MVQRCILLMSLFMMGMAHQGLSQGFQVEKANLISNTPRDIIEALCFGPGIEVVDIEFEGVAGAVGSFSGAQAFVGIDSGFVMTTGVVETSGDRIGIDQPVTELANVDNISAANYEGLDALANSEIIEDVAIYRITFVPANDSILFRYVFASEEYPTFVCSPFNDVFGFYLTGPSTADGQETTTNLAVVPGTTLPVSINSVNSGTAGTHFSVSPDVYCDGNNGSLMNAESFVTNQSFPVYNGFTTIFRAEAAVVPCQTYTMELVLADAGDPFFDSALFFEAESFCSFSGEENVSTNIDPDAPILIEGCDQNAVQLDLTAYSDAVFPLTFSIKGDAQLGLDYDSIPTRGVINEPVDQLELLIQTIEDNIQEDPELLQIILSSDECIADTIELYIIDDLQIIGPTVASCDGSPITLSVDQLAINSLNPPDEQDEQNWINTLTFNWSNGMTGRSIQVSPTETTTYFVEYGNELNNCIASITVTVSGAEITINEALCFNEPGIEVNGTIYNLLNPVGTEIIESSGGCDSIVSINLTPVSSDNFSGTYCEDERFEFGGQVFDAQNPQGTVVVPGGGADGCDLLLNVDLSFIANSQGTVNELLCTNEQLVVGGTVFDSTNPTGEIVLEGVAANGCDSIIQVALSFYEASEPGLVTTTLCTGESIEVNGQIYDENNPSGSFILAGADQNGCDSTVQVAISFYPASGSEATFAIEEGETIAPEGEQLIANGQYTYVYTNVNGCDSTVVVNVSVKPNTSTITDSIAIGYPQSSCVNTDLFQNIASATLDCDDGLDLVTYVLDEEICVSYDGLEVGIDETCVVVCDDLGLCDTTRFIIS
ncbi:MAG: choice-of-anchor L domain-containing protein, partial [Bacteroidota bacterium]